VSFYWGECQSLGGLVPDDQVVLITPHRVAMRGTEAKPARCVALLGDVGQGTRCTMYEQRSSPCRDFEASWVNGEHNPRCDDARLAHGLPPLTPPVQPSISPERVA
jgi:Fe-S-cluster containining protein